MTGIFSQGAAASRGLFAMALGVVTALALVPIEAPPVVGSDKASHLAAFALLTGLALWAFPKARPWRGILPALLAYGLFIEVAQYFLPFRTFSIADLIADLAGILLCLGPVYGLRGVTERRA